MFQTPAIQRTVIILACAVVSLQTSACWAEAKPAEEQGAAVAGAAPRPAASTEPRQTEERSSEGKPALSDQMRLLLAESGDAAAANTALMTLGLEGPGKYAVDEAGVIALGREYLAAGDDATAEVVFSYLQTAAYQATGAVSADVWAAHGDVSLSRGNTTRAKEMFEDALKTDPNHAYSKERLASIGGGGKAPTPSPAQSQQVAGARQGGADRLSVDRRDDLARFRFRYSEDGGSSRALLVSETCYNSGVLRAVPQWGDQTPWVFKSVSDTVFEQVNAPGRTKPVRLEFQVHQGHGGVEGVVLSGGSKGRFEEAGYIPDGFEPERGTCD